MAPRFAHAAAALALLAAPLTHGLDVDFTSIDSIKQAGSTITQDMMALYISDEPGQVPGLLSISHDPYFWWEGGAMFGTLIDYWYLTGDATYNNVTAQGMLFQTGPDDNFMPPNQTVDLGNDDQAFWGFAAMSAAENRFPNPPANEPQWLELAQGVFNSQAARWDPDTCGGGLHWQIFIGNNGYNYKNSIANGCFMQLAARLGRYTGNQTYLNWAEKTYNWVASKGYIDDDYNVWDGAEIATNCTEINHLQWTYNNGVYMYAAAVMWNATQDAIWETRVNGFLGSAKAFFQNSIMVEIECESHGNCNSDQKSYKAYLARWMAATAKVAPFAADAVFAMLLPTAKAAALACAGPTDPSSCGYTCPVAGDSWCSLQWLPEKWDGSAPDIGQQMSSLEAIQVQLQTLENVGAPLTSKTGGNSTGNAAAGSGTDDNPLSNNYYDIRTGDKAGASILTILLALTTVGGAVWVVY